MVLYHITEKKNVEKILNEGLIPKIGPRSEGIEPEPLICLTEEKYIPIWKILLGIRSPKILRVSICPSISHRTAYADYEEYTVSESVSPTVIEPVDVHISRQTRREAMRTLCKSHIYTFSALCTEYAWFYAPGKKDPCDHSEAWLKSECDILERLDYSVLSTEEKRTLLKDLGESGEYTFLDTYKNTDKKLYQLSMYDDPCTYNIRLKFEKLISDAFNDCLDLNTGGWGT